MRVLVTGGAGFIGSHLCRRLTAVGIRDIVVLDNLRRALSAVQPPLSRSIIFRQGDIRDRQAVRDCMSGVSLVFHLAAQSNVMDSGSDLDYSFSSNVVGTFNVLAEAHAARVARVVFASSREVYGEVRNLPVDEAAVLRPKNAYGASKVAGELYCNVFNSLGLSTVILRLSNVYGSGDQGRVVPLFIDRALRNVPLTIFGRGKVLDFVCVTHAVNALWEAATRSIGNEVINIGSGSGIALEELARIIIRLAGSHSTLHVTRARAGEVDHFVADVSKATALLALPPPRDPLSCLSQCVVPPTCEDAHSCATKRIERGDHRSVVLRSPTSDTATLSADVFKE